MLKEGATESKDFEEKDSQEVEGLSETTSSDNVVREVKDYSYLYIRKSSQVPSTEPKIRTVTDNCSFANEAIFDDIWSVDESRNRLQNSELGKFVFDAAEGKTFCFENQDTSRSVKKSKKSKKRMYSELNIEPVVQNCNKKKKIK